MKVFEGYTVSQGRYSCVQPQFLGESNLNSQPSYLEKGHKCQKQLTIISLRNSKQSESRD